MSFTTVGRFYLSRVIKLGELNHARFVEALKNSGRITIGKSAWSVTDILDRTEDENPFFFGKLSKYATEGQVRVVDEEAKRQVDNPEKNLLIASAPFVYLPAYSGLAALHVWNQIQEDVFPRRIATIVERHFHEFFVTCEIDPIADYTTFAGKLKKLDKIDEIIATVRPPNPLFGRIWKPLYEYVKSRNADELRIRETANAEGLATLVPETFAKLVENSAYDPEAPLGFTDTALIMAADGYGSARVTGTTNGVPISIKTEDSQLSFIFPKDPDPNALAEVARTLFARTVVDRDMHHP